jgi:hypothetical protein
MPSDWYFGPVVCVCLLSRIFFLSFPRRRPSELPPLKRHFERKKRYIYVEIYHRVGSQRESLGSSRRIERENTTRQEKYRRGYYSRRNEKLTLCVENFGVLFNVGGLPPPTENAHPPSFFLFESDYQTIDERNNFLFSLSFPPFKFLGALSSFRLNKSRLCLWWRHFDTIRRRPPIQEGADRPPLKYQTRTSSLFLYFYTHVGWMFFSRLIVSV